MEYCYYAWGDAPSCYLELLNKLQKQIGVTHLLAALHELLAHCQNVAS